MGPVLRRYLGQVQEALGNATPLRVMRSSGALAAPSELLQTRQSLYGIRVGAKVKF